MAAKKNEPQYALDHRVSTEMRMMVRLKEVFRQWYGSLSIKEIVSNKKLIAEIEAFERLLTGKEPLSC